MQWWAVLIVLVLPIVGLAARAMLKSYIERLVGERFEQRIEEFRSDLRQKESRISALQGKLIGDRAALQATLAQKRIEAIESIWTAAGKLGQFRMAVMMAQMLKFDEIAKTGRLHEPKMQKFFDLISGGDRTEELAQIGGNEARLFVPAQVWKIFSAYRGTYLFCYIRLRVLAMGETDDKYFNEKGVIEPIREVLPHFSDYLDKYGVAGAAHLIDPLHELLFNSLQASLTSIDAEEQDMSAIVQAINRLDQSLKTQTANA